MEIRCPIIKNLGLHNQNQFGKKFISSSRVALSTLPKAILSKSRSPAFVRLRHSPPRRRYSPSPSVSNRLVHLQPSRLVPVSLCSSGLMDFVFSVFAWSGLMGFGFNTPYVFLIQIISDLIIDSTYKMSFRFNL